jgi:hypothetical protein
LGKCAGSPKADEKKSGEVQESTHGEGVVRKKRIGNVLDTDEVEEDSDRSSTTGTVCDEPKNEELENCPVWRNLALLLGGLEGNCG